MDSAKPAPTNIDEYIATFPADVQRMLEAMRQTIRDAAPQATETINYGMPTFRLNGNLVHFAAHKNHIGSYPTPSAIKVFDQQLSAYRRAIGSVQFPLDQPLPLDLVAEIVKYRVAQALKK